jgi:glutamyl/glutaminyl-tRNA synthetase
MSDTNGTVVTRFAPSPSGRLHIGGARTALFCWALARRLGGSFLVRLEDTDRARSSEASARGILEDLAWLGLEWDEGPALAWEGRTIGGDPRGVGPFRQSERLGIYNDQIDRLIAEGRAYHAFDTPEELDAKRKAAMAAKQQYRYDRAALEIPPAEREARVSAGEAHVVRLRVPEDEAITVVDEVLGEVSFAPGELDDFIIRKRDGYPTYHLAVVVDDGLMGVTHVLRGQEHLANTPKHVALQHALGLPTPVYAHMPLIFNEKGAKMSKRERDQAAREAVGAAGLDAPPTDAIAADEFAAWLGDKKRQLEAGRLEALAAAMGLHLPEVSVEDFRAAGYLPGAIDNFIALLGWTPSKHADGTERERFGLEFLAEDFSIAKIGRSNARFDRVKLAAFNQGSIAELDDEAFADLYRAWLEAYDPATLGAIGADRLEAFCAAVRPRCKTLADAADVGRFALVGADEIAYDENAVKKWLLKGDPSGLAMLGELRGALEGVEPWSPGAIESAVGAFCEARGLGMGKAAQPLRVAMTGSGVSPALGETLALVGKPEALARVDRCLAAHAEPA